MSFIIGNTDYVSDFDPFYDNVEVKSWREIEREEAEIQARKEMEGDENDS